MSSPFYNRRSFLVSAGLVGAALAQGPLGALPAYAQGLAPTQTMRGGSNNYRPNAPLVEKLGKGFFVSGKVMRAGDGAPLQGVRIQIWAATLLGGEREPRNHGSVLTLADGSFRLEMEQIVPNFGQPHAHLAYDDAAYKTVFLRPVMPSAADTSVAANFVLAPA
ncbi:twin-arginine translocation pathway signal [Pseudoruegeria sp. HB172150]|uniref:twin-arginine translocation pathway signal n=1 Tax=Pseudoruegeria sp. HB172150 TaxID=2721164 RepID=UPI001555BF7D|nr:twin-arginine translocation pathway signal [Pseudoruegeria sp. HB172150]